MTASILHLTPTRQYPTVDRLRYYSPASVGDECCICPFIFLTPHFDVYYRVLGMVGMMGAAALTKKRGGYTNTKLHGYMAWAGMMMAGGGLYVIYKNKENMGKQHFTTLHSWGETLLHLKGCIRPISLI